MPHASDDLIVQPDPSRPSGRLLFQGGMEASYIDLADPTYLDFDYLRWMRIVLRAAHARRVLHIGGGACSLARALASEDPGGRQEVCEVDAEVLAVAREQLGLRRAPGLHVRRAEGRAFVASQRDGSWDAIVVDAFLGARVPRHLITVEWFGDIARVAAMALVNVVDDRSAREVRLIAAGLASAYPRVMTLGARVGNTVLIGSAAPKLDWARIASAVAADPSPAHFTPPLAIRQLIAGTSPSRDAQLEAT